MRLLRLTLLLLLLVLLPAAAQAYPAFIRHGEASCSSCHVDPAGAGILTDYGREKFDTLLRTRAATEDGSEPEAQPSAGFLWGAVDLPGWLNLSTNLRGGPLLLVLPSTSVRPAVMALDGLAALKLGRVVASGSLGYALRGGGLAAVTLGPDNAVVSRQHWLGVELTPQVLLRGGRMGLPFGLRNVEHTAWVREATHTDVNVGQQHGVAVSYDGPKVRGEVMGILGNLQLSPDLYRERGYSAFAELLVQDSFAVGFSSLITRAEQDLVLRAPSVRHAHGAFLRWGPHPRVAVLAEGDVLLNTADAANPLGAVGFAQGDFELFSGLHLLATVEGLRPAVANAPLSMGAWLSLLWFAAPHMEVRLDGVLRRTSPTTSLTVLAQWHVFL